jgi:hypothetical protein
MATITIKIETEDLAREVLAHLGYLPGDDIPDLIDVEDSTPVEVFRAPKTHVEDILERMKPVKEDEGPIVDALKTWYKSNSAPNEDLMPQPTRRMPETPKQNAFCTDDEPTEGVEPVESELGAPLEVYSDESKKERDEIYQQCLEVRKSLPSAEERLNAQVEELEGGELLDHLDALADHPDKEMREAVKAYVLREYPDHSLKAWPALKKILDGNP